jgi:anti-sigma B factor antagonist
VKKSGPVGTARQTNTSANGVAGRHTAARSPFLGWGRGVASAGTSRASFDASFIGDRAVLTIWGDLDLLTEPEFRAFLAAVIDCGPGSVELDLGQLNFMDASGLRVIADGTERLGVLGRLLTIRSPSKGVLRVLELSGLTNGVSSRPPEAVELALN